MKFFYKISIDHVNFNYISGWCYHRFRKDGIVTLQLFSGSRLIAETSCNKFREDLKVLNLHPTGNCGFAFTEFKISDLKQSGPFEIRVKGRSKALAVLNPVKRSVESAGLPGWLKKSLPERKKYEKTVVFMHIPKTAGTSFNTLAQTFFPKGTTVSHIELISASDYRELVNTHNFISGHLRCGLLKKYFLSTQTTFYTIIREPYHHLHSHLKWMIQTVENSEETFFKATNKTIYRLGEKLTGIDFSSNRSIERFVDSLDDLEAAFLDNAQTRYFLDDQPPRVAGHDIDTALANASLFELIGTTEQYDHFVKRFKASNGINVDTDLQPLNISMSTDLFDYRDESVQKALRPLVDFDQRLYQRIVQDFVI